jgi:uncharacterized membrane protein
MRQNNRICTSQLWLLVVVLLAVGLFFRFYNLDKKVYWNDEVWSSLRLSGHSASEMIEQVFDGRELTIQDLQRYQRINSDRSWIRTIRSLAADDPKQPPLYYALLRFWAELFGDSIHAIRSLSALISLLVFPGLYWLCRELFETPRTAWVAISFMAVSPFHVLYAQEARPYSLWTATILLSSAALLRAVRQQTWRSWSLYAVTVALGFYSHTLFGLVAVAHAAYVAGDSLSTIDFKAGLPKPLVAYFFATLAALVAFAPWGLIIASNAFRLFDQTAWLADKVGVFQLFGRWAIGLSAVFLDLSFDFGDPLKHLLRVPVVILALYAIYFLYRRSSKRVWLFTLTLIGTPVLTLMLPDLVLGGRSISVPRFLIPCYLGVQIAVVHLLATQTASATFTRRTTWQAVSVVLILCGVVSCAISSQADAWWNKSFISMHHPQAARIINQAPRPLLISDSSGSNPRNVISLSYLLDPKVRLRLVVNENDLQVPDNFSHIFLFRPSAPMRRRLEMEEGYRIEAVNTPGGLWRLAK